MKLMTMEEYWNELETQATEVREENPDEFTGESQHDRDLEEREVDFYD